MTLWVCEPLCYARRWLRPEFEFSEWRFWKKRKKKRIKPGPGAAKSRVKGSSRKTRVGGGVWFPRLDRRHLHKWRHTAAELHLGCVHLCVCSVFAKEEGPWTFNHATVKTLRVHCEPFADPDTLLRSSSSRGSWSEPTDQLFQALPF